MIKPGGPLSNRQDLAKKREDEDRQRALSAQEDKGIIIQIDEMINQAVAKNANSIHMELLKEGPRVRIRDQDENLVEVNKPDPNNYPNLINRVKVISNMDITNNRVPQRGFFKREINEIPIEFETYSFPAVYGEKMVVKVLYKRDIAYSIDQLGLDPAIAKQFTTLLKKGQGLILMVGPPGSGKNTTLYSTINSLNNPTKNVCTLESLIKYNLPGVVQARFDDRSETSYEDLLRALIDQEPDILLVGDIKTPETARLVIQSAFAKRLVFGRLVANDTVNAIQSFLDMGIQSFLVAASIHCVIAQRLVRKLCVKCRQKYVPKESIINEIGLPLKDNVQFYQPVGCPECRQTGYNGVTGMFELLHPTEELREMIVSREPSNQIRQNAVQNGLVTLKRDGIKKAFMGITSVEEVLNSL